MTIADRAVLVTGADRDMGRDRSRKPWRGAKRLYAGTRRSFVHWDWRVTTLTLDLTNAAEVHGAVERVESLDILINNARLTLYDDSSDHAELERHLPTVSFENTALSSFRCEGQLALRRQIPSPGERLRTHGLEAGY